jgi:hypothetical protein
LEAGSETQPRRLVSRALPLMPRKSPHDVNVSADEWSPLESVARRYTSPYCEVNRAKRRLGMSIGRKSSVAAKSRAESLSWIGWSAKSWAKSPTNLLAESFGLWTTALLDEVGQTPARKMAPCHPHSFILRSMPVGSIKSKSISPPFRDSLLTPNDSRLCHYL